LGRQVEGDEVDYHGHECGESRKEVKLAKEKISPGLIDRGTEEKAPVTTYPYGPPVGQTSSDHTPLIVKSSKELPSGMDSRESKSEVPGEHNAPGGTKYKRTCKDHPAYGRAYRGSLSKDGNCDF
jgi:hypothetical protein